MNFVTKYTTFIVVAVLVTATTTLSIGTASAQIIKDNGASGLAGPAGAGQIIGPMAPYAPGNLDDPVAENPGQSGLEAQIIGPNLKCVEGQPPC